MNSKLLEILACPACKAKLDLDNTHNELICHKCKLAYAIDEGIPVMLIDQARKLDE